MCIWVLRAAVRGAYENRAVGDCRVFGDEALLREVDASLGILGGGREERGERGEELLGVWY